MGRLIDVDDAIELLNQRGCGEAAKIIAETPTAAFQVISWKGIPRGYEDNFADGVSWLLERIDKRNEESENDGDGIMSLSLQ